MTEIELKNQVQRAQRAKELFYDPMIQEFIIAIRGDLLNEFESASLDNDKERMSAWNQSQVFNKFIAKFDKEIKTGKNAQHTLNENSITNNSRII